MRMKRMNKTLLIASLLLGLTTLIQAQPVSRETARRAATTFLNNNGAKTAQLTDVSAEIGFANLYVFTNDQSFVILSADSRVQPVLGYSFDNAFLVDIPDNLRWWLQGYEEQVQTAIDNHLTANDEIVAAWDELKNGVSKSTNEVVVSPLLTTTWDQNYPYNYFCPTVSGGPGGHTYAGCVATAMAQVMKYWNYPIMGQGSHTYSHQTYGDQTANFGETTYDWENMPNAVYSSSNQSYIDAIATLMYHCGVAVDMNYGIGGSGASSTFVAPALIDYFRYAPCATYVSRDSYQDAQWIAFLKSELDEGRPLYYSGSNTSSGHAFVFDGYRSDDYFHINWGWSGSDGYGHNNGYWLVGALNPGSGGSGSGAGTYNQNNAVIAWVEPISELAAPILTASLEEYSVNLSWEAVEGVSAYDIYRDNVKLATVNTPGYTDSNLVFGEYHQYYIRSVAGTTRSNPSNFVSLCVTYHNRVPQNLQVEVGGNNISLSWDEVPAKTMDLHYGVGQVGGSYGTDGDEGTYWGQCYPVNAIGNLSGMSIDKVSIYLGYAGQYTLLLYKGVVSDDNNLIVSHSFTGSQGWNEVTFDSVILEEGKDLWVVFHAGTSIQYPAAFGYYEGEGQEHAHYLWNSFSQNTVFNLPSNLSWPIKIHVQDVVFSYNVYRDNTLIAEQLSGTNYQDINPVTGTHEYYVTSLENNWESDASETIEVEFVLSPVEQIVSLDQTWTWWTPIVATNLAELEAAIGSNGILINSQDGGFVRCENGQWSGTLQDFVPGQMYRIATQEADTFTLTGMPVTAAGISILLGYNWFGYMGMRPADITTALGGFTPALNDQIIGQEGAATYNGSEWTGGLTTLVPGKGYVYHSTASERKTLLIGQ